MTDVFDVAQYILKRMGKISTWKLQKLCYYTQAWALVWTETPLFDEDFEAWSNGAVCPELFRQHRGKFMVDVDDIDKGDSNKLSADQCETIDIVLDSYGDMQPYELREQCHNEAPWKDARGELPENVPSHRIITKASMGEYYGSL